MEFPFAYLRSSASRNDLECSPSTGASSAHNSIGARLNESPELTKDKLSVDCHLCTQLFGRCRRVSDLRRPFAASSIHGGVSGGSRSSWASENSRGPDPSRRRGRDRTCDSHIANVVAIWQFSARHRNLPGAYGHLV